MIILLSLYSVHLKYLVQWEPWCKLGLRWNSQASFVPFPFFPFWQLLICKIHASQVITYFFEDTYQRVFIIQSLLDTIHGSLAPIHRIPCHPNWAGNHMKRNFVTGWEVRASKKLRETTVSSVHWLLPTQRSAFSITYTTFKQMRGLVLFFYPGCLGGIIFKKNRPSVL